MADFARGNELAQIAAVECLRARGRMFAGDIDHALRRVNMAVATLSKLDAPHNLALLLLTRSA